MGLGHHGVTSFIMRDEKPLILVVDDETHILRVLSLKLGNAGYHVITAEDGEEALEAALTQHPDLMITDDQMPCLTGTELCERLTAHEQTRDMPRLLLTAMDVRLPPQRLREIGILDVFTKPFSPREILARVRDLLAVDTTPNSGNSD